MSHILFSTYDEPDRFQEAVGFDCRVLANGGGFGADLLSIDLGRLWMKSIRGGPSFSASLSMGQRIPVVFLPVTIERSLRLNGIEPCPDHLILGQQDGTLHVRTQAGYRMASMSLLAEDLATSAIVIAGQEINAASHTQLLRPPAQLTARLRAVHHAACELARNGSDAFQHPATTRAIEQELIEAMIMCLARSPPADPPRSSSTRVVARFEEYLESKAHEPVYVAEICAAIGVSGSTLRSCCHEQLGMGPIHYLWLRRMHLARRALLDAETGSTTVTEVATEYGFWELGRFSVGYRALFGESPSTTIKRSREGASRSILH